MKRCQNHILIIIINQGADMIDLHTHILPFMDDGSGSLDETRQMMESLYNQKVTKVVCTPHFNPAYISLQDFIQKRNESMKLLVDSPVELITGSETMLHEYLFHYSDISDLCISNTRYLLVEFPFQMNWYVNGFELLKRLMDYYDVIPIIAHIERYQRIKIKDKAIEDIRNLGCLIQLNTSSIVNKKSRRLVMKLMKQDYIDVLGSDCHGMSLRPPVIQEAYDIVLKYMGEEYCNVLKHNAECILKGIKVRDKTTFMIK